MFLGRYLLQRKHAKLLWACSVFGIILTKLAEACMFLPAKPLRFHGFTLLKLIAGTSNRSEGLGSLRHQL